MSADATPDRTPAVRLLTQGNLTRHIFALALPATATMFLQIAFNIVDLFWIGRLGTDAVAAVSITAVLIWSVHALIHMVAVGVSALVAQQIGAGQPGVAAQTARQGLWFGLLGSLAVTACIPASETLLAFMGIAPEVVGLGKEYLDLILLGASTIFGFYIVTAAFQGRGDTLTPMKILGLAVGLNALLDPLLIFGWGPFPAWGLRGAALATVVSRLLATVWGLWLLPRDYSLPAPGDRLALDGRIIRAVLRIGFPISLANLLFCFVYVLMTRIVARFGTDSVAALGIGHKLESLSYMTCVGFATAATALVGQNLGAGRTRRAFHAALRTVFLLTLAVAVYTGIYYRFGAELVSLFIVDSPGVVTIGGWYMTIIAFSQIFMGFDLAFTAAFGGAGNTLPPMVIGVPATFARIPVAWYLAVTCGWGIVGVWWAITLCTIVHGVLLTGWFFLRRWERPAGPAADAERVAAPT